MRKIINIVIGLCFLIAVSCQIKNDKRSNHVVGSKTIEGELHFKLISIGSFYDVPDSIIKKFESMIDSLSSLNNLSNQDQQLIDMIKILKENNLIDKPFFHLKLDSTQIVTVYLDEKQYEQLKQFDRSSLINENKKIKISLKGQVIGEGLVECHEVISAKKVDGKTYWRK